MLFYMDNEENQNPCSMVYYSRGKKKMKQYQRKVYLRQAYVDEKRSTRDIANECCCSHTLIYKHLKMFNIPIRTLKESMKRKQMKPAKKKTQTIQEYLEKLKKFEAAVEEIKELDEIIKALRGEESDFNVTEAQAEQNRLRDFRKARAEELQALKRQIEFEKERGSSWSVGVPEELIEYIEDSLEEPIGKI